jgi:hypothetical protein
MRALSDRHRGAQAIALRARAIPQAYRVLFRHLGLEPDVDRIPVEALIVQRLLAGAFESRGLLPDALAVATIETEVGVWALPGAHTPRLALSGGRIVIAGEEARLADLFAAPGAPVTHADRELTLYAILAEGVPHLVVEEALWTVWELVV